MALPELAVFENFLAGTYVVAEKPTSGLYEQFQELVGSDYGPNTVLWLAYPDVDLRLDSVLKKIGEELAAIGAPYDRQVELAVLAILAETKGDAQHVEHANHILGEARQANLLVNFVSNSNPPKYDIRVDFGPTKIEPFDPERLEYWADRGGAAWPINLKSLRGHFSLVGRLKDITLLNFDTLPGFELLQRKWTDNVTLLLDSYFQSVADLLVRRLKDATADRLSLLEASGLAAIDFSSIEQWFFGIHLFTWLGPNKGKAGTWAVFRHPGFVMNIPTAEAWQDSRKRMLSEFGVDTLLGNDSAIGIAAQTFARLMQDARAHERNGHVREAFLYFVIALDQLLGDDGKNLSTVADRTSILTHRIRPRTFEDEVNSVRYVYDVRSRLVHSGSAVTEDDLRKAEALARGVLSAITRIVAAGELKTRDEWVKKLDQLAHLFRGEPELVTDDHLTKVGAVPFFQSGSLLSMLEDRPAR